MQDLFYNNDEQKPISSLGFLYKNSRFQHSPRFVRTRGRSQSESRHQVCIGAFWKLFFWNSESVLARIRRKADFCPIISYLQIYSNVHKQNLTEKIYEISDWNSVWSLILISHLAFQYEVEKYFFLIIATFSKYIGKPTLLFQQQLLATWNCIRTHWN